jgi:hypothetical protein
LSYRRNTLKQSFREAFSIVKYFSNLQNPEIVDKNGDAFIAEKPEISELDVEAQLLAEAEAEKEEKKDKIFNIYETGVAQTLFMEARGDFNVTKITDRMWTDILEDKIEGQILAPRCVGKK